MQIGRKMTEFEAFEVLSVDLEHPVYVHTVQTVQATSYNLYIILSYSILSHCHHQLQLGLAIYAN